MAIYHKHGFVILAGAYLLAACSSNPSPWSQQSSPWGNKSGQAEEVATEEPAPAAGEQYAFVEPMPQADAAYAPVEPANVVADEPVAAEPRLPESEMIMPEPAAEAPATNNQAVTGGDLHGQPAGYFAVQVCASRTMKQLTGFAKRHNLSDQWTAQTTVGGETWYVLLEGIYATRAEARDALARVNTQVDTRPWIRTVGSLQAVMQ